MARTSRVVLNRKAFSVIELGFADGLFDFCQRVVTQAHPPDAAPLGLGLVQGGGALAWVGNKKVAGTTIGGRQIKKPRALKLNAGQVTAIGGFGFPARFLEFGTVQHRAQPFLTRALYAEAPHADVVLSEAMKRRLRKERVAPK